MIMAGLTKNRIVSAIRGAFVADAASMGTHWIYNPTEMAEAVPSLEAPEFRDQLRDSIRRTSFPGTIKLACSARTVSSSCSSPSTVPPIKL